MGYSTDSKGVANNDTSTDKNAINNNNHHHHHHHSYNNILNMVCHSLDGIFLGGIPLLWVVRGRVVNMLVLVLGIPPIQELGGVLYRGAENPKPQTLKGATM